MICCYRSRENSGELIAAGVPTEVTRHVNGSHNALAADPAALADVVAFLRSGFARGRLRTRDTLKNSNNLND